MSLALAYRAHDMKNIFFLILASSVSARLVETKPISSVAPAPQAVLLVN